MKKQIQKILTFLSGALFFYSFSSFAESSGVGSVSVNTTSWEALLQASPLVQLTLLILIFLSITCWAVAFSKYQQFSELKRLNAPFLNYFEKTNSIEQIYEVKDRFHRSSLARMFLVGYNELKKIEEAYISQRIPSIDRKNPKMEGLENIERVLRKQMDIEIASLESKLTWLATTGSTGPFIGLFGTVWGIMSSFHKIGQMGSATLAVVAPGISEALIATAIGLLAAIPAVMLYNHFISQIKKEEMLMSNFSIDFLNLVKRTVFHC